MKLNSGFLFVLLFLVLASLSWNIFLLDRNQKVSSELKELQENYQALEGFNEVLRYDLEIANDSLNLVLERMN